MAQIQVRTRTQARRRSLIRNEELSEAEVAREQAERAAAKAAEDAAKATEEVAVHRERAPSHVVRKLDDLQDSEQRYRELVRTIGRRTHAKQTATRFAEEMLESFREDGQSHGPALSLPLTVR